MRLLLLLAVCVLQCDAEKTYMFKLKAAFQGSRGDDFSTDESYTMTYSIGTVYSGGKSISGCLICKDSGCYAPYNGGLGSSGELSTPSSTSLDLMFYFEVWEDKNDYLCGLVGTEKSNDKLYTQTCRISMEDYTAAAGHVYRCIGDGGSAYLDVYFHWWYDSTQAPPTPSPPTPSPPTPAPPLMCSAFSCPDNLSPKAGNVACSTHHLQADVCGGISIQDGSTGSARCCSHNGADCVTKDAGGSCYGDTLTYSEAMDVCALDGRRLCTLAELSQCCGTGCSYDNTHVWVSDVVLSDMAPVIYCDKETCCDVAPTPAPPTPSPPTSSPPTPSPPPVTNPPATIPPAPTAVPCTRDVVTVVQFTDKDNRQLPVPPSEETLFGGAVQVDMHVIINAYTNYGRFVDIGNGVSSDNFIIGQYKNTGYLYVSSTWTSPKLRVINETQLPLGETFHLRVICVPIDDATSTYYVYINGGFVMEGVSEALRYVTRSQLLIGVSSFTIAGIPHIDLDGSVTNCVMVMCPNPPATYTPATPSPPTPAPQTPAPPLMCSAFSCPAKWSPKAGNVACSTTHQLQADVCGGTSIKDGSTGSARCCSHNGADCVTTDAGGSCYGDTLTYSQAMDVCALDGRRLCTVAELTQCCGTGCSYDYTHVWVSDVVPVSYCDKETCCDAPTPAPPTPSPPTPSPLTPPTYIGCYEDTNLRDLDGASSFWGTHASPELCSEYCLTAPGAPYRYMGLQDSTACMCGNSYGTYGSVPESECSMSCVQDLSSTCGAVWRNSVYEVGSVGTAAPATLEPTPSPLTPPTYIGCYGDTSVRDLDGASSFSGTHASPELCSEYCLTAPGAPFLYMGLQDSTACMCGNSYGTYGSVPESECSMSCSQDPSSMCGNHWRNSVYEVGFSGM